MPVRAVRAGLRGDVRVRERRDVQPAGRLVRLPRGLGGRAVPGARLRGPRHLRAGLPPRLLMPPQQHRAVSWLLKISNYCVYTGLPSKVTIQ